MVSNSQLDFDCVSDQCKLTKSISNFTNSVSQGIGSVSILLWVNALDKGGNLVKVHTVKIKSQFIERQSEKAIHGTGENIYKLYI